MFRSARTLVDQGRKSKNVAKRLVGSTRQMATRPAVACRGQFTRRAAALGLGAALGVGGFATVAMAAEEEKKPMPHRMMGNTGLQVSVLSYGFWATFGAKGDLKDQEGIEMAKQCLRTARDGGVNLFDNAETYGTPQGAAETIMGEAIAQLQKEDPIKWRRSDILVTTKIFWGGPGVNEVGLSRKHIMEGTTAALERLQMSYVDLIFCHRPDPYTPTETVVRAMTDVVRSGKATAWGTSEWSAQQITEAFWIAKMHGLEPPQFEQPQYHMFHRERVETEFAPLYQAPYNMGLTTWSGLASGLLTGKYNESVPAGSRLDTEGYGWLKTRLEEWHKDGKVDQVRQLTKLAEKKGCTTSQLALAWLVKNPNVTTVLLGATKPAQLTENLEAVEISRNLTAADMEEIEKLLGNKPDAYTGYGGEGRRGFNTI